MSATDSVKAVEPQLSRLEKLPAELRNHIYTLSVVEYHKDLYVTEFALRRIGKVNYYGLGSGWSPPALAATNRRIQKEVLAIYYGEHTFVLHTDDFPGTRFFDRWILRNHELVKVIRRARSDVGIKLDNGRAVRVELRACINDDETVTVEFLRFPSGCRKERLAMCTKNIRNLAERKGKSSTGILVNLHPCA